MIRLISAVSLGVCLLLTAKSQASTIDPVVELKSGSFLEIHGRTNVNQFKFTYQNLPIGKPIHIPQENHTYPLIALSIHAFDSGISLMNRDLAALLNADSDPFIHIQILSLIAQNVEGNEVCLLSSDISKASLKASITLAGKHQIIRIPILFTPSSTQVTASGKIKLNVHDFDITPPKRFLGLIVTQPEIAILFSLDLEKSIPQDTNSKPLTDIIEK
jgi:hypothetical protein